MRAVARGTLGELDLQGLSLVGTDALAVTRAAVRRFDGRPTQASLYAEHDSHHRQPRVVLSFVSACLLDCPPRQRLRFRRVRRDGERSSPTLTRPCSARR